MLVIYFSLEAQENRIVYQVLGGRREGEAPIFESMVASVTKEIF